MKKVIKINGDRWNIVCLTPKEFDLKYPTALAITTYLHPKNKAEGEPRRMIEFRGKRTTLDTIIHELTHAYLSYRPLNHMSRTDSEEAVCEVMGRNLIHIHNHALTIQSWLRTFR